MKSFFEEYGFVILAAIVVILLIAMATPIGTLIRSNISHIVESFGEKTTQKLDYAMRELQPKDIIYLKENDKEVAFMVLQQKDSDKYLVMRRDALNTAIRYSQLEVENDNNEYMDSYVSEYLDNTYYNTLSNDTKEAIVSQKITQDFYSLSSNGRDKDWSWSKTENVTINGVEITRGDACKTKDGTVSSGLCYYSNGKWIPSSEYEEVSTDKGYYTAILASGRTINAGEHKVFLPSISEISNVVNVDNKKDMFNFLKDSNGTLRYIWFRDGSTYTKAAVYGSYAGRSLHHNYVWNRHNVRPAFVIDLSKVSYVEK